MSADHTSSLSGTDGLLRGHRTRSYGSLVSSSLSPAIRQRRIEHKVKPGDTLQGLSLKYGVSVSMCVYDCIASSCLLVAPDGFRRINCARLIIIDGANQKGKQTVHKRFNIPQGITFYPSSDRDFIFYKWSECKGGGNKSSTNTLRGSSREPRKPNRL